MNSDRVVPAEAVTLGHGVSVVAVANALGDEPATVLRTYAHLTENDDDRIRSVIGSLWTPSEGVRGVVSG